MTNRDAVVILLQTRTAWIDPPRSQFARFGAVPGEKPTVKHECERCTGDGKVNTRAGLKPCEMCEGKGFVLVDGYTGKTEREKPDPLADKDRKLWRQKVDGELSRLRDQLEKPTEVHSTADVASIPPYRWERERDWHFRHGDYRALDLVLEKLAGEVPAVVQLATWTFEYHVIELGHAPEALQRLALDAAQVVADRMAALLGRDVRVPARYRPKHPAEVRRDQKRLREAA